jgi:4'-phosphopantetheinyl transferase
MLWKVGYTSFTEPLSPEVYEQLLCRLPGEQRLRINRFKRWQDAHASLLGRMLVEILFLKHDFSFEQEKIMLDEKNRPFYPGGPDFNISHSGNMVCCSLANARTGIDIEEIKSIEIKDFKEQFRKEEWTQICNAVDPLQAFYNLWTMKEALLKADGRGLFRPLRDVVIKNGQSISDNVSFDIVPLTMHDGYSAHGVISSDCNYTPSISHIKISELLEYLNDDVRKR